MESAPDRELAEEFEETMGTELKRSHYAVEPMGFVVEDNPVRTENRYARGFSTMRVYRTYRVNLLDAEFCRNLLAASQRISDEELGRRALNREKGRANSVLILPLITVTEAWLALPPGMRYRKINLDGCELDESTLVILDDMDVPEFKRR